MVEPSHSSLFEKAITVIPVDSKTYRANLDPTWCIGKGMNYTLPNLYRRKRGEPTYANIRSTFQFLMEATQRASCIEPPGSILLGSTIRTKDQGARQNQLGCKSLLCDEHPLGLRS